MFHHLKTFDFLLNKTRKNPQMLPFIKKLTEKDMEDIGSYLQGSYEMENEGENWLDEEEKLENLLNQISLPELYSEDY